MPRPSMPPAVAMRLIASLLPPGEREDTLGDLTERFHRRETRYGTAAARRWYWKQAMMFLVRVPRERVGHWLNKPPGMRGPLVGPRAFSSRGIMMSHVAQDVRYAARSLRKNPVFSLIAVATLSLGMGATTAVFSVLNSIVLTPLPYNEPGQLVRLYSAAEQAPDSRQFVTGLDFLDYRKETDVFQDLASLYTYREGGVDLTGTGSPQRVRALPVSADYFDVYRASPLLGRTFRREEELPGSRLAILSHRVWRNYTDSDPDIVGQSLTLNGAPYTVVGVMRPTFLGVVAGEVDVWVPENLEPRGRNSRGNHYLSVIGRLQPGVTIEQAQSRLDVLSANLAERFPDSNENRTTKLYPLLDDVVGSTDTTLYILMGAAGLVLLIACVNVANLSLARSIARNRELSIRAALWSWRRRLAAQLFT